MIFLLHLAKSQGSLKYQNNTNEVQQISPPIEMIIKLNN